MKNAKRTIALLLVLTMMLGAMGICPAAAAETTAQEDTQAAAVSIFPVPQGITADSSEGMKLTGTVDIVIHGDQDVATLPKLEALLDAHGVTYQQADSVGSNAAIVVAVKCADADCGICVGITDSESALTRQQGYVLRSSDAENANGQITIVGADADGAYYGVMSLIQLFDQKTADGRIAEVTVSDYPDVEFRGYVEGFYGYPWSHEDRAQLFIDTSVYKMTTYIYAPKDDPYHRDSWRTLYPEEEANNIKELAQIAAANNMEFVWTIHPGADYDATTDADENGLADDYEILLAKFEQVYSMGVRQFGIFYDDLDYDVANGVEHATVINNSYAYLTGKYDDVKPFITVVTRYTNSWGANWTTYFTPFMQTVHEDTLVLWTGNSTMSAITKAYMEVPKTKTGTERDFGVWWNYPVNDYNPDGRGHLFMQSLDCLSSDVDNIASFFLNPMPDADASKVAIFSGADYAWNIGAFDSKTSWSRAIKELVPEANEEFERFADHLGYVDKGNGFFFDESSYMKADLAAFEEAMASGEGIAQAAVALKTKFAQMAADTAALRNIENEGLLDEISVFVDAYEDLANAGVAMMEAYQMALAGNVLAEGRAEEAAALLTKAQSYKDDWMGGSKTAKVGSYRVVPFLQTLVDTDISDVILQNGGVKIEEKMITNVQGLASAEITVDGGTYTLSNITAAMKQGEYIGIALPKAANINGINVEIEPAANFKLQYSLNGIEWYDYANLTEAFVTAAYARVLCTQDTAEATVSSFSILGAAAVTATTEMDIYKSGSTVYSMSNAIDQNYSTWAWVYRKVSSPAPGPRAGDYVQLDLGTVMPVNDVTAYFGTNLKDGVLYLDAFLEMQLQTSLDGTTWTTVGDTVLRDDCTVVNDLLIVNVKGDGKPARYIRLVEMQDNINWVKLYELEYNQGFRGTAETNMTAYGSNLITKAMDGKLETSFRSDAAIKKDDYIQITFGSALGISELSVYFGGNADGSAAGFPAMDIQVSEDGSEWTTVKSMTASQYAAVGDQYLADAQLSDVTTRYVRLVATQDGEHPLEVHEVCINGISDGNVVRFADEAADALGDFYPDSDYVNSSTVNIAQTDYLDDGSLSTVAQIHGVKQGDVLIYPTTTRTDVDYVVIYQDANAISNAQVSVLDLEGNWTEIGTLSGDYNELAVEKQILAVKLTFDGTVLPMIQEISLKQLQKPDEEVMAVEALIDAIGEVTLEKETAITQAREAYDALTEDQKSLVVNFETLAAAEVALAELKAVSTDEAVAAAQAAQAAAEAAQAKAEEAQTAAEAARAEAEAAKTAAETAQAAAETAKAEAEAAQAAAEAAQAATAQDKTAAEAAQAAAEAAQAKAEEAQEKAEAAKTAAETAETNAKTAQANAETAQSKAEEAQAKAEAAQEAAEQSNVEAAAEAAKAAEEAEKAAEEAAKAATESGKAAEEAGKAATSASAAADSASQSATSAADAAKAAKDAQDAQAKAEDAQAKAEEAQKAAAEEKKNAEEAAKKAEEEKAAAEAAKAAATAEKAAAEAAQKAAEEAQAKAEAAQKATEEAALKGAKYQAALNLDGYVQSVDQSGYSKEQIEALAQTVSDAKAAIEAAETTDEIQTALEEAKTAIDAVDTVAEACPSENFTDVEADGWYHDSVDYMIENGYMNGVSETLFDVNGSVTRGQLVTILYRIEGEPSVEGMENPFSDVEAGAWYTNAVIWAANKGVVKGVSETEFAPANKITREQIVTILYRYDGEQKVEENALAGYTDAATVSAYAADAMNWAIANGIVNGMTESTLVPDVTATRAQISVIVARFTEK